MAEFTVSKDGGATVIFHGPMPVALESATDKLRTAVFAIHGYAPEIVTEYTVG